MNSHELANQIEQLVEDFVAASRVAAYAAVERAFATVVRDVAPKPARRARSAKQSARRSSEEMSALSERLYEAVCAKPGEAMSVIAPVVGVSPRELQVPVARLKGAGRIRSVGQRQFTKYFPMVKSASKSG